MITKLAFNSMPRGGASSLPDAAELKRMVEEMDRASSKIARERQEMKRATFGATIATAVRTRQQQPRFTATATAEANEDGFGKRLRRAVEKKSGKKQHDENAEKEGNRYKPLTQRERTKSD
jgi:hypothetical protein